VKEGKGYEDGMTGGLQGLERGEQKLYERLIPKEKPRREANR